MEDREAVSLCLKGQTEMYAVLVERYQRLACSIAYQILRNRQEAEDITQEAFVRVYRRLKPTADFSFLPYLKTTIANLCWDSLRRQRTAAHYLRLSSEDDVLDHRTPEAAVLLDTQQELLRRAMNDLPAMYREVLTLHYVSGLSYEQISGLLNEPMSIVKNRIFRGKRILKDAYQRLEGG